MISDTQLIQCANYLRQHPDQSFGINRLGICLVNTAYIEKLINAFNETEKALKEQQDDHETTDETIKWMLKYIETFEKCERLEAEIKKLKNRRGN